MRRAIFVLIEGGFKIHVKVGFVKFNQFIVFITIHLADECSTRIPRPALLQNGIKFGDIDAI